MLLFPTGRLVSRKWRPVAWAVAATMLLGIGTTLAGRLVLFDALEGEFTELRLRRDPACPVCSDAAADARACTCIDCSSPMARKVTRTEEPP